MVRRKGRPRRLAPAPKEGPDRKSLVKYVEKLRLRTIVRSFCRTKHIPLTLTICGHRIPELTMRNALS